MKTFKEIREYDSVNEGMPTGNEAGMMFRVSVEGLPDMIMVGKSPGDIKVQLRKIVKQPSMILGVERLPKSKVRKMYRDLAGGKEVEESAAAGGAMAAQMYVDKSRDDEEERRRKNDDSETPKKTKSAKPKQYTVITTKMRINRDALNQWKKETAIAKEKDRLANGPMHQKVTDKLKSMFGKRTASAKSMYADKPDWGTPESTDKAKKQTPGQTENAMMGYPTAGQKGFRKKTNVKGMNIPSSPGSPGNKFSGNLNL